MEIIRNRVESQSSDGNNRREGRIWRNTDRASVAVTELHRFVMEIELKLGTRQGVVCGKAKEDEIISRMDV